MTPPVLLLLLRRSPAGRQVSAHSGDLLARERLTAGLQAELEECQQDLEACQQELDAVTVRADQAEERAERAEGGRWGWQGRVDRMHRAAAGGGLGC